ncbi:MAG: WecB/TagA/CpsF family glycosyltransferase [Acidobacteriaceae bacterium]|nr:WecB/TagA/CpsF family glycosyltransferase [Acidobacteriaceae bacterium]
MSSPARSQVAEPLDQTPLRLSLPERIGIGHASVNKCSFQQALYAIIGHARAGGPPAYVITPNAQHVVLLDTDIRLREIYREADLVVPDGVSLLLAARVFGDSFPERVPGVALFENLCGLAAENNLDVFLLGGRPGSADLAAAKLKSLFPKLKVQTYCPPYGFEKNELELQRIAAIIALARPALLFVALGAPKQEYWIYDYGRKLGATVCLGVGGSFEMVGGVVDRAPRWAQSIGCEWAYRLWKEPRRMWRRYLIGNLQFAWIVLQQALGIRS